MVCINGLTPDVSDRPQYHQHNIESQRDRGDNAHMSQAFIIHDAQGRSVKNEPEGYSSEPRTTLDSGQLYTKKTEANQIKVPRTRLVWSDLIGQQNKLF